MTNQEYMNNWLNELENLNGVSEDTISAYRTRLTQFIGSLNGEKSLTEVKRQDIIKYISDSNISISTKQNRQSVVCSFYNWMSDNDYVVKHPMMAKVRLTKEKRIPEFIEKEDWYQIQDYMKKRMSERNYMIVYSMLKLGTRVSETINIKAEDFNFNECEVRVIGKGNKERIVYFDKITSKVLEGYIKRNNITGYLFTNKNEGKLTRGYINQILDKVSKETGIKLHPHMLRHTYAQWECDRGTPLEVTQKQLGHATVVTTQIYQEIRSQKVKEAVNN